VRYLEFARIEHFAALIFQPENVYTAVVVRYIDNGFGRNALGFEYLFAHEVENLERVVFIGALLKIEGDL
jgi:hypothetical protein